MGRLNIFGSLSYQNFWFLALTWSWKVEHMNMFLEAILRRIPKEQNSAFTLSWRCDPHDAAVRTVSATAQWADIMHHLDKQNSAPCSSKIQNILSGRRHNFQKIIKGEAKTFLRYAEGRNLQGSNFCPFYSADLRNRFLIPSKYIRCKNSERSTGPCGALVTWATWFSWQSRHFSASHVIIQEKLSRWSRNDAIWALPDYCVRFALRRRTRRCSCQHLERL